MESYEEFSAYEEVRNRCKICGQKRPLEDGWCHRCNGFGDDAEVQEANRRAGEKARAAQRRRHPEWFL